MDSPVRGSRIAECTGLRIAAPTVGSGNQFGYQRGHVARRVQGIIQRNLNEDRGMIVAN